MLTCPKVSNAEDWRWSAETLRQQRRAQMRLCCVCVCVSERERERGLWGRWVYVLGRDEKRRARPAAHMGQLLLEYLFVRSKTNVY